MQLWYRIADEEIMKLATENAARIDRLRAVLENLKETAAAATCSVAFPPPMSIKMVCKRDRY